MIIFIRAYLCKSRKFQPKKKENISFFKKTCDNCCKIVLERVIDIQDGTWKFASETLDLIHSLKTLDNSLIVFWVLLSSHTCHRFNSTPFIFYVFSFSKQFLSLKNYSIYWDKPFLINFIEISQISSEKLQAILGN